MSIRKKLLGIHELPHRPPLRARFWVYCMAAYLLPVIVQVAVPDDPGSTDELIWLVTLAPAFLLSLHYGLKGALLGLVMGTGLFVAVQTVLAVNFSPDDWRVTVPIYIAYGTLAISVGWLSEELHKYYDRALSNERMAAVGQMAVTVQHEINNALTSIVAESQFLLAPQAGLDPQQQASAKNIHDSARRIVSTVKKMSNLASAPSTSYIGGVKMIDLGAAETKTSNR